MVRRYPALALLLLITAGLPGWAAADANDGPPNLRFGDTENRWGIAITQGAQRFDSDSDNEGGTVRGIQLVYRAFVDFKGSWLFEIGVERTLSEEEPEIRPGETGRITSTGVFYRFSKMFGHSFYAGGRVGFARTEGVGEEFNSETFDEVIGVQAGYRVTSWLDIGVEAVSTAPDFGDSAGFPGDLRGTLMLNF